MTTTSNRFFSPSQQFVDATGLPYSGGFLYFYVSGTSTPSNTYTDAALTIANTNPIVLNASGYSTTAIFLQQIAYKVVLKDVNAVEIWTADPVYASDYSTYASTQAYNGNPNGFVAGNAATAGTKPGSSLCFDYSNNILYVCTTTGVAAAAVWTAVNPSSGATTASIPTPQGYLTPVSATPVITSNSVAATAIYYTPFVGNLCPIYTGSAFTLYTFTEKTLTLVASHAASTIYDVFMFLNSGSPIIGTGPAWNNSGANTGSRGTGAGTTELTKLGGYWVNNVQITARNGATTYTVAANQATYLGSIFMDVAAGQVTCHRSYGQSRKWGIWNYYNRQNTYLIVGDPNANWVYVTAALRASNNDATNSCTVFQGLAEETYEISFIQAQETSAGNNIYHSIGFDSVVANSGTIGYMTGNTDGYFISTTALYNTLNATIGIHTVTCLEFGAANASFNGTQTYMQLMARWRA